MGASEYQITEAETVALISGSPYGHPVDMSFGPHGVYLKNTEANADNIRRLVAMRVKAEYEAVAHEHDL